MFSDDCVPAYSFSVRFNKLPPMQQLGRHELAISSMGQMAGGTRPASPIRDADQQAQVHTVGSNVLCNSGASSYFLLAGRPKRLSRSCDVPCHMGLSTHKAERISHMWNPFPACLSDFCLISGPGCKRFT